MTHSVENDAAGHEHRFGRYVSGKGGRITERWCVDCDSWVSVVPAEAIRDDDGEHVIPPEVTTS